MLLDAEDDLVVVDLAHHSSQAVDAVARYRPAACILDAQLPDRHLGQTVATAKAASPTTRVLALVDDASPAATAGVLTAGADAWLAKDRPAGRWVDDSAHRAAVVPVLSDGPFPPLQRVRQAGGALPGGGGSLRPGAPGRGGPRHPCPAARTIGVLNPALLASPVDH